MIVHVHRPDPALDLTVLRALADSLEACSAAVDESGFLIGITEAWRTFQGNNPFIAGRGLGSSYLEACEDLSRSAGGQLSIVALGLLSVLKGDIPRLTFDYPFLEGGGIRDYACTAMRPARVPGVQAVIHIRDITERTAMERRMRRAERLFKATTDNAMDSICLLDSKGKVAYQNPAMQRLLGRPVSWTARQLLTDLVHEEDRGRFLGALRQGVKAGLTQIFEYRVSDAQGRWVDLEGQVSAVEDPGGYGDSALLVSRDISFRKDMERERARVEIQIRHSQKLEAIGQLAAGIAHEINTPTQYIGDNTTFLRDAFAQSAGAIRDMQDSLKRIQAAGGPGAEEAARALAALAASDADYLEEEIPKAIQQTLEGVARISKIVGAMKDFSHPGGETASTIDMHRAIESTITVSRGEWRSVAEVETAFDPALPPVPCFPGEISQVILNLVVNAAHAIAARQAQEETPGPGLIRIGTRRLPGEAEIWVSDNGTGIPAAIQARIFDPFFTTKPVGKGSGQGLSIVHGIVTEKHKGRITLESAPGEGATFRLFLPLDRAEG